MLLSDLKIIHLAGGESAQRTALKRLLQASDVLIVETCLRLFAVGPESAFFLNGQSASSADESLAEDAYGWLLATGCGLYSQVIGETEIFSQIKETWRRFEIQNSLTAQHLRPWMQKVFNDVKHVRTAYLQGIGGASYGSLARKILNPSPDANVVMIGSGQLAEAVAPYFAKNKLFVWNRSEERLLDFRTHLEKRGALHRVDLSTSLQCLQERLYLADHLIICTPVLTEMETQWSDALRVSGKRINVLHLGATVATVDHWSTHHTFSSLTHLFALQSEQNELKHMRIRKALAACQDRARQRHLMATVAVNHSSQDLTGFS